MRKLLFTLLLLLTASTTAIAGDWLWANGVCYRYLGNQSVEVYSSYDDAYGGNLVIPSIIKADKYVEYEGPSYDNYRVVGIAENAFKNCSDLKSIVIPGTVKTIGKNAFYGCTALTSVEMGYGVNSIGASAFSNCTSLTSITLPNSVTLLDWNVFYGCSSLSRVTLPMGIGALNGTFSECTSLTSIDIPAGVSIIDGAFKGCTNLSAVNLPRALSVIGVSAFDGCRALRSLDLPNSVTHIGDRAFANTGLTAIEIPDGVTHLGENAFYGSTDLTFITTRATTPPLMANTDGFASDTYSMANLLVPAVSLDAYRSTDWWNLFEHTAGSASLNDPYDFEVNGIYYIITGANTVSVTYKNNGFRYNNYSGIVSIPATVNYEGVTYTVTGVGNNAFRYCGALRTVTLPSTVTSIGKMAFYACNGLRGITIPQAVTSIGDSAFYACTGLTDLTIPENVTSLGTNAFGGISVQSLTWNARECWSNGGITATGIRQLNIGNEVRVLPKYLANNSQITTVDLPSSLVSIGDSAFYSCSGLISLTIPVNVTTIGTNAFGNNSIKSLTWNARECWSTGSRDDEHYFDVTTLTIGDGVEVLPCNFVAYSNITEVNIPASVKEIGDRAFYECHQLAGAEIPDGVVAVGEFAFSGSGIKTLTVGTGLTEVGPFAFNPLPELTTLTWNARNCGYAGSLYYMDNLTQVTIGDGVEYIPPYFCRSTNITSLELPNSVKTIDEYAFCGCANLKTLTLSDSLINLYSNAFYNCSSLISLFIPRSVQYIGYNCFKECTALESIVVDSENTIYDSRDNCNAVIETRYNNFVITCKNTKIPYGITRINDYAFYGQTGLKSIEIPSTVTYIGKCAFTGCTGLTRIDIPNSVTYLGSEAFSGCTGLEQVTLSNALTTINSYTFYGCTALTEVSIPNGITTILYDAFENSGLKRLYIPASVTQIYSSSFSRCSDLESIVVDQGNPVYDSRNNCNAIIRTALNELFFGCKTSVIPNTVTSIGYGAFQYCDGLTTITIPNSVTTIGSNAFNNCVNLQSITIGSNVTNIGSYAFYRSNALATVTCLAPTPPTLSYYALYDIYNATLRVPEASVNAYKATDHWKLFSVIEGIPGSGPGDVNGDGEITINDATGLIDLLLSGGGLPTYADVDGDGEVSIRDITQILDMLLSNP
jgi:hypothetical protein